MAVLIEKLEKTNSERKGTEIFLELAFRLTPRDLYTDLSYGKQTGYVLEEHYKGEARKYFKEFLTTIWYDVHDLKRFEAGVDAKLLNSSNKVEMFDIFIGVARDIAAERKEKSKTFWDLA